MTASEWISKMPRMNRQASETIETPETREDIQRTEAPKPLFVRHLQNAKLRSGIRAGVRNMA